MIRDGWALPKDCTCLACFPVRDDIHPCSARNLVAGKIRGLEDTLEQRRVQNARLRNGLKALALEADSAHVRRFADRVLKECNVAANTD